MSERGNLLVGTRDSILARRQTELALKRILSHFPECAFEIVGVKTSGDKILNRPLSEFGGRGVFVKELEEHLMDGRVDFVVHSLKDLPVDLPDNLCLAATIDRTDPRDVLVCRERSTLKELPAGARVATSSRRRVAQLSVMRNDLKYVDIRGNIQTRLRKLDEGECDAMVLAAAGLLRLGLGERVSQYFEPQESTPAVGQGALAIECRADDERLRSILEKINDQDVWSCTTAERAFLHKLGGGCSVPVGALGRITPEGQLQLSGCVVSIDGARVIKGTDHGGPFEAALIGSRLAEKLISLGADQIIASLNDCPTDGVSPP